MAFGGVQVNTPPSGSPNLPSFMQITGLTLAARVGAPAPAAADTGVLTTAAAAVNENGIPSNFGLGRGNWTANAVSQVVVTVQDPSDVNPSSDVHQASKALVGNDLVITLHNRGTVVSGSLEIQLDFGG